MHHSQSFKNCVRNIIERIGMSCAACCACGVIIAAGFALVPDRASAQSEAPTIIVEKDRAFLVWNNPPDDPLSRPERFVFTCVSAGLAQPVTWTTAYPASEMPLSGVVLPRGFYECTVRAENGAGSSPESNVAAFGAGSAPDAVTNLRIEIR